jgi:uncharacterized spore protein YtfJ
MAGFQVGDTLAGLVAGLAKLSEAVNVIGEPIQAGDKLIIPAVVVRAGFGAGGGGGPKAAEGSEVADIFGGSGGGGGLLLTPVFLIIDDKGERLVSPGGAHEAGGSLVEKIKEAAGAFRKARESTAEKPPDAPHEASD